MESDSFEVTLEFLSDWHIGSGTGIPGSVDRQVKRDLDGLPFVPAKTLTGVLRDNCEMVAHALGRDWDQWIDFLFGTQPDQVRPGGTRRPRAAALAVRPARYPEKLRDMLRQRDAVLFRQSLSFVKPGVAIDDASGTARHDHLRFEERARKGVALTTELTIAWPSAPGREERNAARALLLTGLATLEYLGGKRRRGSGRVAVSVRGWDREAIADMLDTLKDLPRPPSAGSRANQKRKPVGQLSSPTQWTAIPVRVRVEDPVVIASAVVGNVTETLPIIPGTTLIPYVLGGLSRALPDVAVHELFRQGKIQVRFAYPEIVGCRGLPAPRALETLKTGPGFSGKGGAVNRFIEGEPPRQSKSAAGYVGPFDRLALPAFHAEPETGLYTHASVDDERQRPIGEANSGSGPGVFSYEAILPGQTLRTEIAMGLDRPLASGDISRIRDELNGETNIGRSSKDDYGRVVLETLEAEEWSPGVPAGTDTTLRLLSPVVSVDAFGRPDPTVRGIQRMVEAALKRRGIEAIVRSGPDAAASGPTLSSVCRARRFESWQRSWSLPRPSIICIDAGSSFRLKIDMKAEVEPSVLGAALLQISREGLGERRGEGYGEIIFGDPLLNAVLSRLEPPAPSPLPAPPLKYLSVSDGEAFQAARTIEELALRETIRRAARIAAWTRDIGDAVLGKPCRQMTNSRWGSVRHAAAAIGSDGDMERLRQFLKARRRARGDMLPVPQWPSTITVPISLVLDDPERCWSLLRQAAGAPGASDGRGSAEQLLGRVLTEGAASALGHKYRYYAVRELLVAAIRVRQSQAPQTETVRST